MGLEPISTGAALVGAGAWFANKILGPAAADLGENLKSYSSDRWRKIFQRAEEIGKNEIIQPMHPSIASVALIESSLSEDNDLITDMWASLFIDASSSERKSHRLFIDILSHLSGEEASYIESLTSLFFKVDTSTTPKRDINPFKISPIFKDDYRKMIKKDIDKRIDASIMDRSSGSLVRRFSEFRGEEIGWPSEMLSFYGHASIGTTMYKFQSGSGLNVSLDTLIRERVLDHFEIVVERDRIGITCQVVALTNLGLEFVTSCKRGRA